MKNLLVRFVRNESGATAIEYGLIAGLISVVIITMVSNIGGKLLTKFTAINVGLGV
jgi:pilus assembly protein Flp/PilA